MKVTAFLWCVYRKNIPYLLKLKNCLKVLNIDNKYRIFRDKKLLLKIMEYPQENVPYVLNLKKTA